MAPDLTPEDEKTPIPGSAPRDEPRIHPEDWDRIPPLNFPPPAGGMLAADVETPIPTGPRRSTRLGRTVARYRRYHGAPMPRWYAPRESIGNIVEFWKRPWNLFYGLLFLMLATAFVLQSSIYWTAVIDDSYITFRFVDMFVKGHGWRFSPEGPRVEGFTNFLWAVTLVPFHMMGWDLMAVSKILGLTCGIAAMAGAWGLARSIRQRDDLFNLIPPALLAFNAHFAHWAQMGLETLMQCGFVALAYYRFEKERRDPRLWLLSPVLAVLAAMTRIDSLFYLAPLGLYGWWLVGMRRLMVKRLLTWAVIAGIPFGCYQVWRLAYFGDWAPNTYYAKQRFILFEGQDRGIHQLKVFYFNQARFQKPEPAPFAEIRAKDEGATARKLDRAWWNFGLIKWNSFLWMNFWLASLCLSTAAAFTTAGILRANWRPRRHRASAFMRDVHLPKIFCLALLPWGMNLYYVYHVNGDWMPSFRFFQISFIFIGTAAAVGFGWLPQLAEAIGAGRVLRWLASLGCGVVALYLLLGTANEQMRVNSVFIFSKDAEFWGGRESGWYKPAKIEANFNRGFSPPLGDVANFLLTETQDNGWIFMSDIGQPLWFAEHLNLYDVDGLTDPYLAHAPSVRGDLPTVDQHFQDIMKERNIKAETLSRAARKELVTEAMKRDFEAHLNRNAKYIMEEKKPEYLLLFLSHEKPDPKTQGWAYPAISAKVYQHPAMKNYEEIAAFPKIGNVFNHVFKRKDIPREVPDSKKLARLFRAVERNPRMPALITLLYRDAQKMKGLSDAEKKHVADTVGAALRRWDGDPAIVEIANAAQSSGDGKLAREALLYSVEKNPANIQAYWALANMYEQDSDYKNAAEMLTRARKYAPDGDNSILYHLTYLSERNGDLKEAMTYAREATDRLPRDPRAWSDLGALLERNSWDTTRKPADRLAMQKEAVKAFSRMAELSNPVPAHIPGLLERLNNSIAQLEPQLVPPTPAGVRTPNPPPTPEPDTSVEDGKRLGEAAQLLMPQSTPEPPPPAAETNYE